MLNESVPLTRTARMLRRSVTLANAGRDVLVLTDLARIDRAVHDAEQFAKEAGSCPFRAKWNGLPTLVWTNGGRITFRCIDTVAMDDVANLSVRGSNAVVMLDPPSVEQRCRGLLNMLHGFGPDLVAEKSIQAEMPEEVVVEDADSNAYPMLAKHRVRVQRLKRSPDTPSAVVSEDFKRAVEQAGLSALLGRTAYTMSGLGMYPDDAEDFLAGRRHLD